VELQFGEGGDDSKLFVHDLSAAYLKYGTAKGFQAEVLTSENGHAILQFKGKEVYEAFQHESGGHCVQRIPPTEPKGRRQTSMISVGVLPIPPADPKEVIPAKDLEITTQTGKQGAGGQNVNKVASAVRIVHMPTGLRVFINGRDQHANRKEALKIIAARVNALTRELQDSDYVALRRKLMGDGGRGAKVRTYNFIAGRVTDHRFGVKARCLDAVMKGRFDLLFSRQEG
jgi:peptide chain release factor 1